MRPAQSSAALSRWAVLDATEGEVYFANLYPLRLKDGCLESLDAVSLIKKLGAPNEDGDVTLNSQEYSQLDLLRMHGVVRSAEESANELQQVPSAPSDLRLEIRCDRFTRKHAIEVTELFALWRSQRPPFRRLVCTLLNSAHGGSTFENRLGTMKVIQELAKTTSQAAFEACTWRIVARELGTVRQCAVALDADSQLSIELEDDSDVVASNNQVEVHQSAKAVISALSAAGYVLRVTLPTSLSERIEPLVRSWLDANEGQGVAILPQYIVDGRAQRCIGLRPIASVNDAIRSLFETVRNASHLCSPWREYLEYALTPGVVKRSWQSHRASLLLDSNGLWYRSTAHAHYGLSSSRSRALAELPQNYPGISATSATSAGGFPDCSSCRVVALCSQYWTAHGDVCRLLGYSAQAKAIAHAECAMKMVVLEQVPMWLHAQWHENQAALRANAPVVSFRDGRVVISTGGVDDAR